jgi:hypothetical protein
VKVKKRSEEKKQPKKKEKSFTLALPVGIFLLYRF